MMLSIAPAYRLTGSGEPRLTRLAKGILSIMEFDRVYSELLYELHSARRKNIVERTAIVPESKRKRFRGLRYQDPTTDTYVLRPRRGAQPLSGLFPQHPHGKLPVRASRHPPYHRESVPSVPRLFGIGRPNRRHDRHRGHLSGNRTTYHTCAAIQQQGLTPAIVQLVHAVEALGDVYGLLPEGETEVSVSYGDGVFEDTQKEFVRRMEMLKAGVIDADEVRKWYFGGETKDS